MASLLSAEEQARIAELVSKAEDLIRSRDAWIAAHAEEIRVNASLRAEIAELHRDKERLDAAMAELRKVIRMAESVRRD